jgi:mono/diheme cytochrome c family protein
MKTLFPFNIIRLVLALLITLFCGATFHAAENEDTQRTKITKECTGVDTDDCIVRKFKDSPEASVIRGKIVYQTYCVLCHGVSGQGDGRAAKIHTPKPANLVLSRVPPDYLSLIIRKGGEAMGRSKAMPPWGDQLTDEQIRDLINHLVSIRTNSQ